MEGSRPSLVLRAILFVALFCAGPSVFAAEQQVICFPHFAAGGGYTTTWLFTGYASGQSTIQVAIFDRNGRPLPLVTDLGSNSTFHLVLNGYGTASLTTTGADGPLNTGWVMVTSDHPVGAMEIFQSSMGGGPSNRASVLPSEAVGSATLLMPNPQGTAVALSTRSANSLSFKVLDREGTVIAITPNYELAANSQLSLFVNQIPGLERVTTSNGSLEIAGSAPFYVTTLLFSDRSFASAPVLIGRAQPLGARSSLLNEFNAAVQRSKVAGDQLLAPPAEDLQSFAPFLSQPQTGLIRLLPRETYDGYLTIRGGGSYYSFSRQTHEYGFGSDIELQQGYFSVGFAGADFGLLTNLGDVPVEEMSLAHPGVQYLATYNPPTTLAAARAEQQRSQAGFTLGGYNYMDRLRATSLSTFVLRSICYNGSDVLVAFRVVRFDTDGSAIVVWKILRTFPVPKIRS